MGPNANTDPLKRSLIGWSDGRKVEEFACRSEAALSVTIAEETWILPQFSNFQPQFGNLLFWTKSTVHVKQATWPNKVTIVIIRYAWKYIFAHHQKIKLCKSCNAVDCYNVRVALIPWVSIPHLAAHTIDMAASPMMHCTAVERHTSFHFCNQSVGTSRDQSGGVRFRTRALVATQLT